MRKHRIEKIVTISDQDIICIFEIQDKETHYTNVSLIEIKDSDQDHIKRLIPALNQYIVKNQRLIKEEILENGYIFE